MNEEVEELLKDIQEWMMENDYECGAEGSEIYQRIKHALEDN